MPAKSEKQRRLFGAAISMKEGNTPKTNTAAGRIARTMDKETIREFVHKAMQNIEKDQDSDQPVMHPGADRAFLGRKSERQKDQAAFEAWAKRIDEREGVKRPPGYKYRMSEWERQAMHSGRLNAHLFNTAGVEKAYKGQNPNQPVQNKKPKNKAIDPLKAYRKKAQTVESWQSYARSLRDRNLHAEARNAERNSYRASEATKKMFEALSPEHRALLDKERKEANNAKQRIYKAMSDPSAVEAHHFEKAYKGQDPNHPVQNKKPKIKWGQKLQKDAEQDKEDEMWKEPKTDRAHPLPMQQMFAPGGMGIRKPKPARQPKFGQKLQKAVDNFIESNITKDLKYSKNKMYVYDKDGKRHRSSLYNDYDERKRRKTAQTDKILREIHEATREPRAPKKDFNTERLNRPFKGSAANAIFGKD